MKQSEENAAVISKILSGARWATILRLFAQIVSWSSTIFVVRFVSTTDYGLNAMLETPLEIMFLLSTFGLDTALVRSKSISKDELRSAFGWLLCINGLLFLAYFFGSTLIASYFNEPRLELLAKVVAFVFLLVPFRVIPNALLDRDLKFKLKATAELIASIITAITILILAFMGFGIWALVTGILLNRALLAIMLMALKPWFILPSLDFLMARKMIVFGGMMALSSAVAITSNMLPALIAGPKLGTELLGIFVVSVQFAQLPLAKIMPIINPIIFPAFSKFQGQEVAIAHYFEKTLGVASLALLPIMVGTACIAEEFVIAILGEQWVRATLPLAALSLVMPFRGATSFIRQVSGGIGHAEITLKSTLVTFSIFLPMILVGSSYGINGIVAAILLTEPIVAFVTVQMSKRVIDTSFRSIARSLFPSVASSSLMATCVLGVKFLFPIEHQLSQLFLEIGVGAATYLFALRFFFANQLSGALALLKPQKTK